MSAFFGIAVQFTTIPDPYRVMIAVVAWSCFGVSLVIWLWKHFKEKPKPREVIAPSIGRDSITMSMTSSPHATQIGNIESLTIHQKPRQGLRLLDKNHEIREEIVITRFEFGSEAGENIGRYQIDFKFEKPFANASYHWKNLTNFICNGGVRQDFKDKMSYSIMGASIGQSHLIIEFYADYQMEGGFQITPHPKD